MPPQKVDKLVGVLHKLYSKIGEIVDDGASGKGIHMPMDESAGESKGFAFIEYAIKKDALAAVEQTHGHMLDKAHVLSVCQFSEFQRIVEVRLFQSKGCAEGVEF